MNSTPRESESGGTAAMADEEASVRESEGIAYLCLSHRGGGFQGHFISKSRSQFGLIGRPQDPCHCSSGIHQCCLEEESEVYTLTVLDYEDFLTEHDLHDVLASGGDNISLSSEKVQFYTDELLVGQRAEECIKKYFSEALLNKDYYICIGEMHLTVPSS